MDSGTLRLVIFSFIISLLFPVFAFAFTTITGDDVQTYDIVLDEDDLINAGISLTDAVSYNMTFGDPATEFYVGNITVRAQWWNTIAGYDRFQIFRQNFVERSLGIWGHFPMNMKIGNDIISQTPTYAGGLENQTIVNHFDAEYNWTMFELPLNGLKGFISTRPEADNNISQAIYVDGNITLTLGSSVTEFSDWNFRQFIGWYWSLFIGATDWGLPSFMSWIVRAMQGLTMISGVLIIKELTRL